MNSPARRHYQRHTAARDAGAAPHGTPQNGDQYEVHAAALWEARRTLKGIQSLQGKIAKKRELVPEFESYVAGVLDAGNGAQDDVLMTLLVWRIDIGDLPGALAIAGYAMRHSLQTPDRYERHTPALVAEEVADQSLRLLEAEHPDTAALVAELTTTAELVDGHDMHDEIRAKLHKALGYAHRANGQPDDALHQLQQALTLNERAGVKKDIERLERELKQQTQQAQQTQQPAATQQNAAEQASNTET